MEPMERPRAGHLVACRNWEETGRVEGRAEAAGWGGGDGGGSDDSDGGGGC